MLTFSELLDTTKAQRRNIMLEMERSKHYHPLDASLYTGLSRSDALEVKTTMDAMSFAEVLAKSSTTGIQGAAYLVAPKLHDTVVAASQATDIVPLISAYVVDEYAGNDLLNVMVNQHRSYKPAPFSSAGGLPVSALNAVRAQLTPDGFGLAIPIGNDLLEDSQYGLIEWHTRQAAQSFGEYASELALTTLKTGTDGDGTVNGDASGDADETKWTGATTADIKDVLAELADDRWIPDTIVITTEAWDHSVKTTHDVLANNIPFHLQLRPPVPGFDAVIGMPPMDLLFSVNPALHLWSTDTDTGGMTNCVTILFDRQNALLVARKRWLQIENYADPMSDLTSAVISARQGSVTLYNDAIGVITET